MWKQQNRVLTAGTLVVRKDYRMRLKDDFSLELTQLKPDDQGTYTCEIDVMGKPISIKHKVSCIAGFILLHYRVVLLMKFFQFVHRYVAIMCRNDELVDELSWLFTLCPRAECFF